MNYAPRDSKSYVNWPSIKVEERRDIIAVDQEKLNLTWLVFPEIDEMGLDAVPAEFVESIHTHMDKTTRKMLKALPLTFMRYWDELMSRDGVMALTVEMPDNFRSRMLTQAHKAQARLVQVDGNVITPPIWRQVG